MNTVTVWAPNAGKVDLQIQGSRLPMERCHRGWWLVETPLAQHGADYAFILDEGEPLPDPRSPWQPKGVHGPSRMLDHRLSSWHDSDWRPPPLSSAIVYELHVGTFSSKGTFDGIEERLEYLVGLGVTHIELMPVNGFSGSRGWGYDGVNLFAPHEAYGGPGGLKHLVDDCHAHGLAVVLDVVYNHLGPEGNYLERFAPYLTDRYSSPWGKTVNFDGPDSDEVRRFLCDNALMWLRDYHFDGLRIDAVHAIVDQSAVHFLEELAVQTESLEAQLGRQLVLIAESDLNDPRVVRPREVGGYGIDAQWSDDFHHALHTVLTGEKQGYYVDFGSLGDLAKALKHVFVNDGRYSDYRKRVHGRPTGELSGHRFLGYIQNHDQVGNRARGDRLTHLASQGKTKIASTLVFTSPFIPMIFQGEEWGASTPFQYFTDHQDEQLGQAVRQGRRRDFSSFGWNPEDIPDPQALDTFERSKLNWDECDLEPHRSILAWYRRLIDLRRSIQVLNDGRIDRLTVCYDEEARCITMQRGAVTVACNFADKPRTIPLGPGNEAVILISSDEQAELGRGQVHLPPESVVILELREI